MFVMLLMMTSESHEFRQFQVLGNVVLLLFQDISELERGYENSNFLISATNFEAVYDLPGYIYLLLICHC